MNRITKTSATLLCSGLALWALAGCALDGSGGSSYFFDLSGLPNDVSWYDVVVQSQDGDGTLLDNFSLGEKKVATDTVQKKHPLNPSAALAFVYLVGSTDYPLYFTGWDLKSDAVKQSHQLREQFWLNYWYYVNEEVAIYGLSETQAAVLTPGETKDMQFLDRPYYLFTLPSSEDQSYSTTLTVLKGGVSARAANSLIDLNLNQSYETVGSSPTILSETYLAVAPVNYNDSTHATLVCDELAPTEAVAPLVTHGIVGQKYSRLNGLKFGSPKYVPRN